MSRRDCSGFMGRMKSSSIKEQIEDAYPNAEEYPPDVDQRMTEIESRLDQHNDQPRKYREKEYRSLAQSWRLKTAVKPWCIAASFGPRTRKSAGGEGCQQRAI
jgi:hypothetical protein